MEGGSNLAVHPVVDCEWEVVMATEKTVSRPSRAVDVKATILLEEHWSTAEKCTARESIYFG